MQTLFSRWSTLAVLAAAVGSMSFAGCTSTARLSRMPGMGWLAKNKTPDKFDSNGVPVPPSTIATPAGAQKSGGMASMNNTRAVPNYAASVPNYAASVPSYATSVPSSGTPAPTAATGPHAAHAAASNNTAPPPSGYPLNRYGAGTTPNPASSQPWSATTQPAAGTVAPQRGLYATGTAGTPPNYGPREGTDPSRHSPRSEYGSDTGYARTADSRSRYGGTPTAAAAGPDYDRWGGSSRTSPAPREASNMQHDAAREASMGSATSMASPSRYTQPAAPSGGARDSRFSSGNVVTPSTASMAAPAGPSPYEPRQPYPRTDARADYLSPAAAPAATAVPPTGRGTTIGTNPQTPWFPGSTSRYPGTPAAGSTDSVRPVRPGPVAPASFSNETATVPDGHRHGQGDHGGATPPATPAAAGGPAAYGQPSYGTRTY